MKRWVNSFALGVALVLGATSVGYSMSSLSYLSVEPEWPNTTAPGTVVLYRVTAVSRAGQGLLEVWFSCLGLPAGTIVSCTPSPLRFTGNNPVTLTALLAIDCGQLTATDTLPFALTATAQRETMTITNQATVPFATEPSTPPLLDIDLLSDGGIKLRGQGVAGQSYRIETTEDLGKPGWTSLGSSTSDGNGRFSFFPTQDARMRFYRAVWSPPGKQ